jgi:hypothetical protein
VISSLREITFSLVFKLGIILFYATVMYLNTTTNKNHTITSNVNNAWYDIVSSLMRLISIERSGMISILPPVRCQVHDTIVVKLQLVSHNLPYQPYHITPHCKTNLDASTLSFACFRWLLGLSHKNHFLPTNMKPQHWLIHCCFESLLRALRCTCHIHYSWRNGQPTSQFYTVQVICQSWNQSYVKHVKSVFG